MKLFVVSVLIILCSSCLYAQTRLRTYYENVGNTRVLFADNDEYCPVTHVVNLRLVNVTSSLGPKARIVVPARTKRYKLLTLVRKDRSRPASIRGGGISNIGDHTIDRYDENYAYHLPYKKGKKIYIWQGYDGKFSHRNTNAIDFKMKQGTTISAIRGGVVIRVIENNDRGCALEKCKKYNNAILIYHSDGTFAEYLHIKKNGSMVKEGDIVKAGQGIALSGNTGWSTGPHLHLSVFQQKMNRRITLKTKFLVKSGKKAKYLVESKSYKKKY